MTAKRLYNKHKQLLDRRLSLEVKQFNIEQHLEKHKSDYVSVIANELIKSELARLEYSMKENYKRMEMLSNGL